MLKCCVDPVTALRDRAHLVLTQGDEDVWEDRHRRRAVDGRAARTRKLTVTTGKVDLHVALDIARQAGDTDDGQHPAGTAAPDHAAALTANLEGGVRALVLAHRAFRDQRDEERNAQ